LHIHSALLSMQKLTLVKLGPELPFEVQPGHSVTFYLPQKVLDAALEKHVLSLEKAHVEVYFGARRPLRDRKTLAKSLA
ncbi:MAG: hypothetical protein LC775_01615, partial [Acidobacteria bacterium]|nr:hypothetical protein [Acidobacteriota bacterium]